MHQRRTFTGTAMGHRARECGVAGDGIRTIYFLEMEIRETGDQARDISAGGLHFNRNGDGILVVFDTVENRELVVRRRVERLPEFAFASGTVPERNVGDFVLLELHVLELTIIAVSLLGGVGMARKVEAGFRATHGLQNLRSRRRRLGHDVELLIRPVRRHLPAAGTGVVGRAYGLQKHFIRSRTKRQAQRAVAIVGVKPVVACLQREAGRHADGFMSRAGDLEKNLLLALQQDLPVINAPGHIHDAIGFDELLAGEALVGLTRPRKFVVRRGQLGISFGGRHPFPQKERPIPRCIVNRNIGFRIYWIHSRSYQRERFQSCKVSEFE